MAAYDGKRAVCTDLGALKGHAAVIDTLTRERVGLATDAQVQLYEQFFHQGSLSCNCVQLM